MERPLVRPTTPGLRTPLGVGCFLGWKQHLGRMLLIRSLLDTPGLGLRRVPDLSVEVFRSPRTLFAEREGVPC